MKPLTRKDLKTYQTRAASALASLIQEYPSARLRKKFDTETGELLPLLCRLKAITGAGKTPILALTAQQLGSAIVLWTTNRGAVIAQTKANLQAGGRYAELLPEGTTVYDISQMQPEDWRDAMTATEGLTILLSTVAAFNQESDRLKIHQDRNGTTYWKMLGGDGEEGRVRPLYVFYDEGHGANEKQFRRLRELRPSAFVLASASPLPEDFNDLLPGSNADEREESLKLRTVPVPTQEVVKAGLLKTRLLLVDCNIAAADAVGEAQRRWEELAQKFAGRGTGVPIACFIVNKTERGLDIWEQLVDLDVPKERIAVHLNGAESLMTERRGMSNGLHDTLKQKLAPEELQARGYTHLIWNLSLREGWDEPMAYVAYLDDKGKSPTDMVQKMGRFVRQPNAVPYDDADLNSAFFYFNVTDSEFEGLLRGMQSELTTDGYEVIAVKSEKTLPPSRFVPVKKEVRLPQFGPSFGSKPGVVDKVILEQTPLFHESALRSPGRVFTRVFGTGNLQEDLSGRTEETREENASVSVFDFVTGRLANLDKRIAPYISGTMSSEPKMRQRVQFGSEAMAHLAQRIADMRDALNELLILQNKGRHSLYSVEPFNLVSPDITGVSDRLRELYHVRQFAHALHDEYNGLNPFEVEVAYALDALELDWCRNPSRTGYAIPVCVLGADVENFYPDFLLWTKECVWAIDPKGAHLKEAAVRDKVFDVMGVGGVSVPVRVALVLEGRHTLTTQGTWTEDKHATGVTLVRRVGSNVKTPYFTDLGELMQKLLGT